MKAWLILLLLACGLTAHAHIGSPNVIVEANAGEYPVRVVVRPPPVVPGLAEITVRVAGEAPSRVTALPVYGKAGRKGAPPADVATPVRGETNLYTASLWLMKLGAYSVEVAVEGARGQGMLIVPVNSLATNTEPMSPAYGAMLAVLGAFLVLAALKIAAATFGESRLAPGAVPTTKDRWIGRGAMALTALIISLALYGGKKWWDFEDRNYRNNALYRPLPLDASVRVDREQPILTLGVDAEASRGRWTPLLPDHGKLMHLFLVRDGAAGAFAHLHPVMRHRTSFETPLPPLPAGRYHVYADVTHEDGMAETLTTTMEVPATSLAMQSVWLGKEAEAICSTATFQRLATNLFFPPDADDSWKMEAASTTVKAATARAFTPVGDGYQIAWENPGALVRNRDASLRFTLLTRENQPVPVEPYMGMRGHAVVRREDGAVFAHLHPVGTFSMAAQQFFTYGKPKKTPADGAGGELPEAVNHVTHTNAPGLPGEVSFPYAFPEAGQYRIWVQMKTQGRILTGAFEATVQPE